MGLGVLACVASILEDPGGLGKVLFELGEGDFRHGGETQSLSGVRSKGKSLLVATDVDTNIHLSEYTALIAP